MVIVTGGVILRIRQRFKDAGTLAKEKISRRENIHHFYLHPTLLRYESTGTPENPELELS